MKALCFVFAGLWLLMGDMGLAASRCGYFLDFQSERPLKILITAGGSKERIDDVRFVGNFSSGSFGRSFALAAAERGHQVVVLAPKEFPRLAGPLPEGVEHRIFFSASDLQSLLQQAAREQEWDIVLQSAAIGDFTPAEVTAGKISSDGQEELHLRLVKTPKIIRTLRGIFGRAFLVGFKLLSNSPPEERYAAAMKQLKICRTNLCIENDLSEVSREAHKVRLVTPEGGAIPVPVSDNDTVAAMALNFIERRYAVQWFQTVQDPELPVQVSDKNPGRLLRLAQQAGLLPNESGNVSWRLNAEHLFAISPRGKNKSLITPSDMIPSRVDLTERKIFVNNNEIKPSIDSSVAGRLYQHNPHLLGTIHSHGRWFLGGLSTCFPYPCGVKQEGDEIQSVIDRGKSHALQASEQGQSFIVQLVDHGSILGIADDLSIETLERQWAEIQRDLQKHWQEVGVTQADLAGGHSEAIVTKEGLIGVVRVHSDGSISPRILPTYQGLGYGRELIERIKQAGLNIKTIKECKVVDYYRSRGFEVIAEEGRTILMQPLGQIETIESAIAVIKDDQGRVLMLKRGPGDPNFPGFWSLPGGGLEPGETSEEALIREVREETGLEIRITGKVNIEQTLFPKLHRKYIIHHYTAEVISGEVTLSSEHTEFRWLPGHEASQLSPMGPITRRVIQ